MTKEIEKSVYCPFKKGECIENCAFYVNGDDKGTIVSSHCSIFYAMIAVDILENVFEKIRIERG